MKTNQTMIVKIGRDSFKIDHKTMFGSLNEFWTCGNAYRMQKGLPARRLDHWLASVETLEYIVALEKELLGKSVTSKYPSDGELEAIENKEEKYARGVAENSPLFITKRGRYGGTWAHLYVLMDAATYLDPDFKVQVYKTFVEGKLLVNRDESGDLYKALNIAIDNLPDRTGRDNKWLYVYVANKLADKLGLPEVDCGNRWNGATVAQMQDRVKLEDKLTTFMQMGFVRDWEHLKEVIEKL